MRANIDRLLKQVGGVALDNLKSYPFEILSVFIVAFLWAFEIGSRTWGECIATIFLSTWLAKNISIYLRKPVLYYTLAPLVIIFILLFNLQPYFDTHTQSYSIILIILASLNILCFHRESQDSLSQRVTTLINAIPIGLFIALIAVLLMIGFTYSISALFQLKLSPLFKEKIPQFIAVGIILPHAVIYQLTHHKDSPFTQAILFISKWIALPLILLYSITLYLFLVRVLFTQDIPANILAPITLGFIFGAIYLSMILPNQTNKIYSKFLKYIHIIVAPPLLLLTIDTANQLIKQGVTTDRYILIVLSITLFIYIFITFKRDINKIGVTLSISTLLLIITLFAPYINMYELTRRFNVDESIDPSEIASNRYIYFDDNRTLNLEGYTKWIPINNGLFPQYGELSQNRDSFTFINASTRETIPLATILERRIEAFGSERIKDIKSINYPDSLLIIQGERSTIVIESYNIQLTYTNQIKVKEIILRGLLLK
ncbi:MAG: hypothetical protein ACRCZM_06405 [Bacteroidales bacterium]